MVGRASTPNGVFYASAVAHVEQTEFGFTFGVAYEFDHDTGILAAMFDAHDSEGVFIELRSGGQVVSCPVRFPPDGLGADIGNC